MLNLWVASSTTVQTYIWIGNAQSSWAPLLRDFFLHFCHLWKEVAALVLLLGGFVQWELSPFELVSLWHAPSNLSRSLHAPEGLPSSWCSGSLLRSLTPKGTEPGGGLSTLRETWRGLRDTIKNKSTLHAHPHQVFSWRSNYEMLAIPQLPKQILEFILSKSISTVWIPHRHYPDIARMVLGLVEVCWSGMQVALPYILHRLTHPTYFIYPPYFPTRHAYKPRTPPCQSYVMISIWRVVEWRKYKACCVCWTSQIDWNLEKVRNQVVNTVKFNIVFSFGSFETIKLLNSWTESPTGFNMHACQNADRSRSWAENDTTVKLRKCQKKPNGAAQWRQGTVQQITASSGCEACNWMWIVQPAVVRKLREEGSCKNFSAVGVEAVRQ